MSVVFLPSNDYFDRQKRMSECETAAGLLMKNAVKEMQTSIIKALHEFNEKHKD